MSIENTAIARAIRLAGGQELLAEQVTTFIQKTDPGKQITQQAVSLWYRQGYAPRKRWPAVVWAVQKRVSIGALETDLERVKG